MAYGTSLDLAIMMIIRMQTSIVQYCACTVCRCQCHHMPQLSNASSIIKCMPENGLMRCSMPGNEPPPQQMMSTACILTYASQCGNGGPSCCCCCLCQRFGTRRLATPNTPSSVCERQQASQHQWRPLRHHAVVRMRKGHKNMSIQPPVWQQPASMSVARCTACPGLKQSALLQHAAMP